MNVNQKLDRFRQWGKDKVIKDSSKTTADDEYKSREQQMNIRYEVTQRLHASSSAYIKSLNKRTEGDSRDKQTPVAHFGSTMTKCSQELTDGSQVGPYLAAFGQANERIGHMQETYAMNATSAWLESSDRSLAQMKDYQNARKKLESCRQAYQSTLTKQQKAKTDDYRIEEDLRAQKATFEESEEDVARRMQDIEDAESDSISGLTGFLEAEIAYHERCLDTLMQLRNKWPVPVADSMAPPASRRPPAPRSRTNTLSRVPTTSTIEEDGALQAPAMPWRASRPSSAASSPRYEHPGFDFSASPSQSNPLSRAATNESINTQRSQLKPVQRRNDNVFGDANMDDTGSNSSADGYSGERSISPATTTSQLSRTTSWSTFDGQTQQKAKKAPPPPPPNRSTKPPPPPPMKRSALSTSSISNV